MGPASRRPSGSRDGCPTNQSRYTLPKSALAKLRRRWHELARRAVRLSRFLPPERPHALRELRPAYADRGRVTKAWKRAAKSGRVAEAQMARYEPARSLLVRGRLAKRLGRPEADDQIRTATAEIARIEGAVADALLGPAP